MNSAFHSFCFSHIGKGLYDAINKKAANHYSELQQQIEILFIPLRTDFELRIVLSRESSCKHTQIELICQIPKDLHSYPSPKPTGIFTVGENTSDAVVCHICKRAIKNNVWTL